MVSSTVLVRRRHDFIVQHARLGGPSTTCARMHGGFFAPLEKGCKQLPRTARSVVCGLLLSIDFRLGRYQ